MAQLEYDIILARPGYNEKYKKKVTWEELRKTFLLYRRIPMIVAGGSHSGPIDPNLAIGFVDAKVDADNEIIRGTARFYKEKFDELPVEIQSRLLHNQHVPASLGYEPFQDIRKVDHIAIGVANPVFDDIGFHAESNFYYEETEGIGEKEEPKEELSQSLGFNEKQMAQLRGLIQEALKPPEPESPVKDAEEAEPQAQEEIQEPPAEEQPKPQPKPLVEPERKPIPKEQAKQNLTADGMFEIKKGVRIISSPIGASATKKEHNQR